MSNQNASMCHVTSYDNGDHGGWTKWCEWPWYFYAHIIGVNLVFLYNIKLRKERRHSENDCLTIKHEQ